MAAATPPSYRIQSYNTLIACDSKGENWCNRNLIIHRDMPWAERCSRLVTKMTETHPDVICLQEVVDRAGQARFADFADRLAAQGYTGLFGRRPDGEGCAIFYNTHRFEHITNRTIDLGGGRIALMARLRSVEGDIFNVASLHLNHEPHHAGDEVAVLRTKLSEREREEPTVITGDFNLCRKKPEQFALLRPLLDAGFKDPHPVDGPGSFRVSEENLRHGRPGSDKGDYGIDYTLVSRCVTAKDAVVLGTPEHLQKTPLEFSDHLPVQVEVSFPDAPKKSIRSMLEEVRDGLHGTFHEALDKWKRNIPESVRNAVYGQVASRVEGETYYGIGEHAFLQENGKDVRNTIRRDAIQAILDALPPDEASKIAAVAPVVARTPSATEVVIAKLQTIHDKLASSFDEALTLWRDVPSSVQNAVYGRVGALAEESGIATYFGFGQHAFLKEYDKDIRNTVRRAAIQEVLRRLHEGSFSL